MATNRLLAGGFASLLAVGLLGPVRVTAAPGPPGGSLRAPKSQLPLPVGSQPVRDESVENPRLPAAMGTQPVGERVVLVNVAECRLPGVVSLETAMAFFQREGVIGPVRAPEVRLPPVMPPTAPGGRAPRPMTNGAPDPGRLGRRGAALPAPRVEAQPAPVQHAVFPLPAGPGHVVVTTTLEGPQGPTRVRIAQVIGNVLPGRAMQVADDVAAGRFMPNNVQIIQKAPPLPPGAAPAGAVLYLRRPDIPALVQAVEGMLPNGVSGPLRALLQQADAVSVGQYTLPRSLEDRDFFAFYQQAARTGRWQPVLENPVRPGSPAVIYQLPDGQGILSVHARSNNVRAGVAPGTTLTVIQLQGVIDVGKAMPQGRPGNDAAPGGNRARP